MGTAKRKRRGKRSLLWLGALLSLLLITLAAMLGRAPIAQQTQHPLDLERLSQLAGEDAPLPNSVEVIEVCKMAFPRVLVVGGDYLGRQPFSIVAFRVGYPDHSFGLIDTGLTRKICRGFPGGRFFPAGQQRVQAALGSAKFVVLTHEHLDHAAGLAHFDGAVPGARITREQLFSQPGREAGFKAQRARAFQPIEYSKYLAVAPGVVLIKAPGHTPGSQMVFVRREAGAPLLFTGDIAWIEDNLSRGLTRPWLSSAFGSEDHGAIRDQLRAIVDASRGGAVIPIVGHDGAQFQALVQAGVLSRGPAL